MDKYFWPDFIAGIYFAIATIIFLVVHVTLVMLVCQKLFKLDEVWGGLIVCLLLPLSVILVSDIFPETRSLRTPSTPTVIYSSRGATVMPDLGAIPLGTILGISTVFGVIYAGIMLYSKISSKKDKDNDQD